ncbi:uncharacterized protein [Diadema setosum]|uniref:uncharacterized protein n=1 Tax=Diadema setosum TaxID=31175 RepID=UPI003B3B9DBE
MIILRLQGLPWSATAKDIRQYFEGLSIPDGGVHIIGGEEGDVFIAFTTDDDARKAMQRQKQPLCGSRIMLLLSSKAEMQEVIAESRATAQSRKPDPFAPNTSTEMTLPTSQPDVHSREGNVLSSQTQNYQNYHPMYDQRRGPIDYPPDGHRSGSDAFRDPSPAGQGYDSASPPSHADRVTGSGQPSSSMYRGDIYRSDADRYREGAGRDPFGRAHTAGQFMESSGKMNMPERSDGGQARQVPSRDFGFERDVPRFENRQHRINLDEQKSAEYRSEQRYQSEPFANSRDPWPSDHGAPYQRDQPRSLLGTPGMSKPTGRDSAGMLDDPMEGISTSYPPGGSSGILDYSRMQATADEDDRTPKQGNYPRQPLGEHQPPVDTYRQQTSDESSPGFHMRYDKASRGTRFSEPHGRGDQYWAVDDSSKTTLSRQAKGDVSYGSKSTEPEPFGREDFVHASRRGEDEYLNQRSHAEGRMNLPPDGYPNMPRTGVDGSHYGRYDSRMPYDAGGDARSNEYSLSPFSSSQEVSSDFDSRRLKPSVAEALEKVSKLPPSSIEALLPTLTDPGKSTALNYAIGAVQEPKPPSNLQSSSPFLAINLSGLPYHCTENDIKEFLRGINILPGGIQFVPDSRGNPNCAANVKVQSSQDIEEALRRDKRLIGKRYIDVRACSEGRWERDDKQTKSKETERRNRSRSPLRSENTAVEVKGVPSLMQSLDIESFFTGLEIKPNGIAIEQSKDTSGSVTAYVDFIDSDNAQKACQKSGRYLGRRSVSVRIISRESFEAKRNDIKKKVERRSPGRRSPDRRKGSSPHSRRGRSPGRRGRSPSSRSSRSSPGRNGSSRRGSSPSRKDSRDRDSSTRSGRRGQSPSRNNSAKKDNNMEKRDSRDASLSKPSSRSESYKDRGDSHSQERGSWPEDSRKDNSKSLLPRPVQDHIVPEEGEKGHGLLKTPDQPIERSAKEFGHESRDIGRGQSFAEKSSDHERGRDDRDFISEGRRHADDTSHRFTPGREPDPANRSNRDSQVMFDRNQQEWQRNEMESRREFMSDRHRGLLGDAQDRLPEDMPIEPAENRRGFMDDRRGEPWRPREDRRDDMPRDSRDNRASVYDAKRDRMIVIADPHDEHRGRPSLLGDRGPMPMENRFGGPMDNRHTSLLEGRPDMDMEKRGNFMDKRRREDEDNSGRQRKALLEHPEAARDRQNRGPRDDHHRTLFNAPERGAPDGRMGSGPVDKRDGSPFDRHGFPRNDRQEMMETEPFRERAPFGDGHRNESGRMQFPPQEGHDSFPFHGRHPEPPGRGRDRQSPHRMRHGPGDADLRPDDRRDTERMDSAPEGHRRGAIDMQFSSQEGQGGRPGEQHGPRSREREEHRVQTPEKLDINVPDESYVCAHLRNVAYSARWPDIAHFLSGLQIVPGGIHIMVNAGGKPNGHCFVEFIDRHQAMMAEERRLQPLNNRSVQVNVCSKMMMIRALEEAGELQQNTRMGRPRDQQLPPRGPNPHFGPRGPPGPRGHFGPRGFHGNPRPFPGPRGPPFDLRGPHSGPHFRPPMEGPPDRSDRPQVERPGPSVGSDHHGQDRHGQEHSRKHDDPQKSTARSDSSRKDDDSDKGGDSKPSAKEPDYPKSREEKTENKKKSPPATTPKESPARPISFEKQKGCVISATNLPLTITVDSILEFFKGFSIVPGAVKVNTNEATGKATGEAKIVFTTSAEANRAVKERNNRPLNGRIVRLHVL